MAVQSLDHVTIRPRDLDATRDFYVEIIGLREGARPPFGFPGYWLYAGDRAVIHLIGADHPGDRDFADPAPAGGALDHVAFAYAAEDYDGVCAAIEARGIERRRQTVPDLGLRQLFIEDPDGLRVELNFPAARARGGAPRYYADGH